MRKLKEELTLNSLPSCLLYKNELRFFNNNDFQELQKFLEDYFNTGKTNRFDNPVIKISGTKNYIIKFIKKKLKKLFYFTKDNTELFYSIYKNLKELSNCIICGKKVSTVLSETCSIKCRNKYVAQNTNYEKRNRKSKKTVKEKYGVDNISQLQEIKDKKKKTLIKKYGSVDNFYKSRKNILNKDGINIAQNHLKNLNNLNKEFIIKNFIHDDILNLEDFKKYYGYIGNSRPYQILKKFNIFYKTEKKPFSKLEKEIIEFIKSIYFGKIIENDRKILNGKELDIYIPEKNLAIEFDGLYWHSFNQKELIQEFKYKHLEKTEACEVKNINLLHIFENEWLDSKKQDIWKSIISYKLGITQNKYFARKLKIKKIKSKEARDFFEENHLQGGSVPAKIAYGLYDNNELISCMTFSNSRFNKKYDYELIRFASKKYSSCVGCAQKLFKAFIKDYNPSSIISYANRRWASSLNNLYKTIGFKELQIAEPNFYYFKLNELRLWPRIKFQKYKLKDLPETKEFYEPNKSAIEIVFNAGYRRIYDSGNLVYNYKPN